MTSVWIVTTHDLGGNTGTVIQAVFSTKAACDAWIDNAWAAIKDEPWAQDEWWGKRDRDNTYEVEEHELDPTPQRSTYWHRGAHVYPDGKVDDWWIEHQSNNAPMEIRDDTLEPWNGHSQGHCGWHVSIFGSDKDALEAVFQRQVASVLPLCDGTCRFCGEPAPYKKGFWDGIDKSTRVRA